MSVKAPFLRPTLKSYEYIGAVKPTETFWSFVKRDLERLLGLSAALLVVVGAARGVSRLRFRK